MNHFALCLLLIYRISLCLVLSVHFALVAAQPLRQLVSNQRHRRTVLGLCNQACRSAPRSVALDREPGLGDGRHRSHYAAVFSAIWADLDVIPYAGTGLGLEALVHLTGCRFPRAGALKKSAQRCWIR